MISSTVTTHAAVRKQGVCRGTLWRREAAKGSAGAVTSSSFWSGAEVEYCTVSTNWLSCHESFAAYERGDAPTRLYRIVGASSLDPKSFQLVTNQGTQLYCQALTQKCRDFWLETLHAGLELTLLDFGPNMNSNLPAPSPQVPVKQRRGKKYCLSCGALESNTKPIQPTYAAPILQYGCEGKVDMCKECSVAQGLLDHLEFVKACMASAQQEHDALIQSRELCLRLVTQEEPDSTGGEIDAAESTSTKNESTEDSSDPPESNDKDTAIEAEARTETNQETPDPQTSAQSEEKIDKNSDSSGDSWTAVDKPDDLAHNQHADPTSPIPTSTPSSWIHISPTDKSTASLTKALLIDPQIFQWKRVSPFLQTLSEDLLQGRIGVPDFFEQLDDAVGKGDAYSMTALKRQAFRVAGDMGTAMRMLYDHALPKHETEDYTNTQTLACLLEFFLDLCEDGELSSVGFFWPQLCHIHLSMLPPENAYAVARVDLMEDFLMTVATKYSVQLALELVWSHTADLEESLGSATCSSVCRSRRYAVLRFVAELESVLFGHEDGWGGGSVTLGRMLSATGDQLIMLGLTVAQIQEYRSTAFCRLNNSVRRNLALDRKSQPPEKLAEEKLRIARNADYFTTHLNFTKRLCDIAEKLRFMDVSKRAEALVEELTLLNASGSLGGDPLNRIHDSFIRVIRVPNTEGHVFRSKERTPVLLLLEQVDEGAEMDEHEDETDMSTAAENALETMDTNESSVNESPHLRARADSERSVQFSQSASIDEGDRDDSLRSSTELEGASEHRVSTSALRRFAEIGDDQEPVTPTTPKAVVEKIVTDVMVEQLNIDLPELKKDRPNSISDEEGEGEEPPSGENMIAEPIDVGDRGSTEIVSETKAPVPRRMFKNSSCELSDQPNDLAPTGDIRREVLNVIMMTGRKERNSIAAGAADSAQQSLKELETRRATALLLDGVKTAEDGSQGELQNTSFENSDSTTAKLASLGFSRGKGIEDDVPAKQSEEDEVMEAVRLLLVQNRVAQGQLSPADASKVLQHQSLSRVSSENELSKREELQHPSDMPTVDAGDLDPRLAGCGPLPPAVLQALTLWKGEMVTNGELLELVKKDIAFVRHSVLLEAENVDKLKEDSAFWGRFAFGERWAEKKSRLAASSPQGTNMGWDLTGIIVKSNDDLRQEAFIMQLIELCQEAFQIAGLELWVSPYRILATGRTTGIIEMVHNAMSFDALKKRPGYGKGGLREHLLRMTEFTADPGGSFKAAQLNFVRSLAAYSLMSYFFLFKDRHNGNLLLDTAGHVIHIDFGFVFGVAPGGSFSLEMSTPFKLTEEMLEVMGGLRSQIFSEFVTLFCCGFLALQSYSETFFTLVEITCRNSTFKCFEGRDREELLSKLRERFCPDKNKEETIAFALDLIKQATTSSGTKQYDMFQYLSQGIAA